MNRWLYIIFTCACLVSWSPGRAEKYNVFGHGNETCGSAFQNDGKTPDQLAWVHELPIVAWLQGYLTGIDKERHTLGTFVTINIADAMNWIKGTSNNDDFVVGDPAAVA
jgi:hypothetical protein